MKCERCQKMLPDFFIPAGCTQSQEHRDTCFAIAGTNLIFQLFLSLPSNLSNTSVLRQGGSKKTSAVMYGQGRPHLHGHLAGDDMTRPIREGSSYEVRCACELTRSEEVCLADTWTVRRENVYPT